MACAGGNDVALDHHKTNDDHPSVGFRSIAYFGFTAPPGTPDAISAKIAADIASVLAKPEIKARIQALGATVVGGTPADMDRLLMSERAKWSVAIKTANIPQVE